MDQTEKDTLKHLRGCIDEGEEFGPTLLARYNDLLAQEAREKGKKLHQYSFIVFTWLLLSFPAISSCIDACS
jgi:hypothetical protein